MFYIILGLVIESIIATIIFYFYARATISKWMMNVLAERERCASIVEGATENCHQHKEKHFCKSFGCQTLKAIAKIIRDGNDTHKNR